MAALARDLVPVAVRHPATPGRRPVPVPDLLLLTIGVSILAQNLAGLVLNSAHSGFIAAMVAIPFAMLTSRIKATPPAGALTMAAFWSLVPGQLTFMSVSRSASGDYADTASMSAAGAAIMSIALGTLVGGAWFAPLPAQPVGRTD